MKQFKPNDLLRFLSKVCLRTSPGCWTWLGAKSRGQGNTKWYGSFHALGRTFRAHKFSFLFFRPLEWVDGNHLDHLCNNSLCVNPWHLESVPREENQRRKVERIRSDGPPPSGDRNRLVESEATNHTGE